MVEQRTTHLKTVSHAGPIYFDQNVVHEVGLDVHILDARKRIRRAGCIVILPDHIGGVVAPHSPKQVCSQQLTFQRWRTYEIPWK